MPEKEISLIREQIERLHDKKFDLDSWKNQTVIYLERIFGKESTKVKLIRELHYDYSSWSLRDASGLGQSKDPVKEQAEGMLDAIIEELQKLGLPGEKAENSHLLELLHEELTGKQMREIESLVQSELPDRQQRIAKIVEGIEKENLAAILARLILT